MTLNDPRLGQLRDFDVLNQFAPFCAVPGPKDSWHDFIGVRTRCQYLPASFGSKSGTVEGAPGVDSRVAHDLSEWIGTLRSVLAANGEIVAVELGAGWAPWLVACGVLAKRRGIKGVKLIGVEGSRDHLPFMRQHFVDNSLDPDDYNLLHGVVGPEDGIARFPRLTNPSEDYGARAGFRDTPQAGNWDDVQCYSLHTLLSGLSRVDILHCDIQGGEIEVLSAGRNEIDKRVCRVALGTHSRAIDAELLDLFSTMHWVLESEAPCQIAQQGDRSILLVKDGIQVWRNPRFQ
jgi:FkbM family methyltransferase